MFFPGQEKKLEGNPFTERGGVVFTSPSQNVRFTSMIHFFPPIEQSPWRSDSYITRTSPQGMVGAAQRDEMDDIGNSGGPTTFQPRTSCPPEGILSALNIFST